MPYIISAGTLVNGFGVGIQSINLNMTPQIQRLYELGSIKPFDKNITQQYSLSISKYSRGVDGDTYTIAPSINCDDVDGVNISISTGNCAGGISISDKFYITSYSYNKDIQGWGIESYNLITKPIIVGGTVIPRLLRGVAEGQTTIDGGANTGVVFNTGVGYSIINGNSIEVTAGSPGIGKYTNTIFGEVSQIGGGTGKADGLDGVASVNIPYIPIYMP